MISYSELGRKGRLGNELFQIASTIGIAMQNNTQYAFPKWKYEQYFKKPLPLLKQTFPSVRESHYHYTPIKTDKSINLQGWFQSEKYWKDNKEAILKQFTFKDEFKSLSVNKLKIPQELYCRQRIAISIRRGDFVGNPNYYQLPITYYILALLEHFPDYADYNLIFFSDDIGYCKVNFECLPNAYFAEGMTDIEQLAAMTCCGHFIISNSTFSWWGAYLGQREGSKVIRPMKNIDGPLAAHESEKDYWPPNWVTFEHEGKKIDLTDVTFTIPVHHDHHDRMQNLNLSVCLLQRYFETNIIVGEQGSNKFGYFIDYCEYWNFNTMKVFHRTKMLNDMAKLSDTPFVANWDCDVIIPPMQLYLCVQALRSGAADMVYPYDGRFARVPRIPWFQKLEKFLDIGIAGDTPFKGKWGKPMPISSVGGAVIVNKEKFIESGMENEHMVNYGPEDCERWDRWHMLGYNVVRIPGTLYHIDHFVGPNSSSRNPVFKKNHDLLDKIRKMNKAQLRAFVDTWRWHK